MLYQVIRAFHGVPKGAVIELAAVHRALAANVAPAPEGATVTVAAAAPAQLLPTPAAQELPAAPLPAPTGTTKAQKS